jgi:hypothetical protein
VDRRVEPPSWLPDGAASSDTKSPASPESAVDGQDSDGPESQGPASFGQASGDPGGRDPADGGFGGHDPAGRDPSGDLADSSFGSRGTATQNSPGQDAVGLSIYSYRGETSHSNGQDAAFGPDSTFGQDAAFGPDSTFGPDATFGPDTASAGAYSPAATPGSDTTSAGAYSPESGYVGGAGSPPPYPAQYGEAATTAVNTADASRRAAVFSGISPANTGVGAGAKAGASTGAKAGAAARRGRRADLVVARFEPWSVMKFSFLISLVAWVILFVAVAVLYFALSTLGVFDSVQRTLESVTSSSGSSGVSLSKWFSASRILGYTMLIGAVNIVLITALATVGSMIYNLVTHLGGGIEVTLRETD